MNVSLVLSRTLLCAVLFVGLAGVRAASAEGEPDLDIATPAIMSLKKSLGNRFVQLKPHLEAGVIGLTHDGIVALRDAATIDVKALITLDALIIEENKDRITLYREIASANGRPEWESDLRNTFGKRWISRLPAGWFYRDEKGLWVRKP